MAPRAYWRGFVKISLVSFPVNVYPATGSASKIALNQLHKDTKNRIKMVPHDPEMGPVSREDLVKGYEFEKGRYVIIAPEELDQIKIESTKTIDIEQFVKESEIDELFVDSPYYLTPDGPVAQGPYSVLMEAMRRRKVTGIARVVMGGRERLVALRPRGKGSVISTLRYSNEVRGEEAYFEDIKAEKPDKDLLKLAEALIEQNLGKFDPAAFTDRYSEAVLELVKAKIAGETFEIVEEKATAGEVISLMDALRQSVEAANEKKPPAKRVARRTKKKTG